MQCDILVFCILKLNQEEVFPHIFCVVSPLIASTVEFVLDPVSKILQKGGLVCEVCYHGMGGKVVSEVSCVCEMVFDDVVMVRGLVLYRVD